MVVSFDELELDEAVAGVITAKDMERSLQLATKGGKIEPSCSRERMLSVESVRRVSGREESIMVAAMKDWSDGESAVL